MIVGEMNAVQHRYPQEARLGQFETFVIPLGDPPRNEWIGVEDVGASRTILEAQFLSRAHG